MKPARNALVKIGICTVVAVGVVLAWMWVTRAPGEDVPCEAEVRLARVVHASFDEAGLEDVLRYVRDVAGVEMRVDWDVMEQEGYTRDHPVTLVAMGQPLSWVLRSALDHTPYHTEGNVVTLPARESVVTRVYDVRDLGARATAFRDDLAKAGVAMVQKQIGCLPSNDHTPQHGAHFGDMLSELVSPEDWVQNGGKYRLDYVGGHIVVGAPEQLQREVKATLDHLRAQSDHRLSAGATRAGPVIARMRRKLSVEYEGASLKHALEDMAEKLGVEIVVDPEVLTSSEVSELEVTCRAANESGESTLRRILASADGGTGSFGFVADERWVMVTSMKEERWFQTEMRAYDVRDVVLNAAAAARARRRDESAIVESLRVTIMEVLNDDDPRDGIWHTGLYLAGMLVINANPADHGRMEVLLQRLRQGEALDLGKTYGGME